MIFYGSHVIACDSEVFCTHLIAVTYTNLNTCKPQHRAVSVETSRELNRAHVCCSTSFLRQGSALIQIRKSRTGSLQRNECVKVTAI